MRQITNRPMRASQRGYGRIGLWLTFATLIAIASYLYVGFRKFADSPLQRSSEQTTLEIPPGSSVSAIVRIIGAQQPRLLPSLYWRVLLWQVGASTHLHAGEYALTPELTPRELLKRMLAGEVIQHKFTIVEGWTFHQLRLALAHEPLLVQTLPGLSDDEIMQKLGAKEELAEGRFLPETYAFVKGQNDLDVLRRSYQALRLTLEQLWPNREPDLFLNTPYQALILASIVERETARAEERPQIAGVFLRRLKQGMRLQTDPTVIYGLGGSFNGNLTRRDLDADTPFNTYTRLGLPPTPIALPGKAALEAVLHPQPGNALYFVARGDGTHEFSDSLEAHNRAVAKYQLHKTL